MSKNTEYSWRNGCRISGDAKAVGEELQKLSKSLRKPLGGLTPDDVVTAAKNPRSALNPIIFKLGAEDAAQEHYKATARHVLRSIQFVTVKQPAQMRHVTFTHVNVPDAGPMYVTTDRAIMDLELRAQILQNARAGLSQWQTRYRELSDLVDVMNNTTAATAALDQHIAAATKKVEAARKKKAKSRVPAVAGASLG